MLERESAVECSNVYLQNVNAKRETFVHKGEKCCPK